MRMRSLLSLAFVLLLAAPACDKSGAETTPPPDADAAPLTDSPAAVEKDQCHTGDPADEMLHTVLDALLHEDKSEMLALADGPLTKDLTDTAFEDLSKVMYSLGSFEACEPMGAGKYMLSFTKGDVEARLTVEGDKVHGMYFGGSAFAEAEHSVLGDAELVFKIYDFKFADEAGDENPGGKVFAPGRQHFLVVVGGFEAKEGEHHVTVRKTVTDAEGKVVYESPDEIDISFVSNLEGVRTAMVLKYVDIEKPGAYHMVIALEDQLSGATTSYEDDFEVKAAE